MLDPRSICLDGAPGNKNEALDQMVALMAKSGKIKDEEGYRKQVYAREEESTTGIGDGIAGSAVAGAMSMAFQCTLMAPHGGIFVFMVVGNAWMYLVALLVGTAVSTALLGILKKNVI